MKKYNKPVIEVTGLNVEDVITVSAAFSDDENYQKAFESFLSANGLTSTVAPQNEQALVFESQDW